MHMKKNITPAQVYEIIAARAKKKGQSPSAYVIERGVSRYVLSKWKHKKTGTINLDMAQKLGIV